MINELFRLHVRKCRSPAAGRSLQNLKRFDVLPVSTLSDRVVTLRRMTTSDWSGVRDTVLQLADAPRALEVFGANLHRFVLAEPLSEAQVREVEDQIGTALPADYRGFLRQVGAGGAGPSYGIFTLRETAAGWRWFDGRIEVATSRELICRPFPDPLDTPAVPPLTGAIPVCHHGCGFREWLVVTGAERGTMWCDPEGEGIRLCPDRNHGDPDDSRMGFERFYRTWLDGAVRTATGSAGRRRRRGRAARPAS